MNDINEDIIQNKLDKMADPNRKEDKNIERQLNKDVPKESPKQKVEEPEEKLDSDDIKKYGRERRKKRSSDGLTLKLHVEERFKREGFTQRWVMGTPTRLQKMQQEDWDFVEDPDLAAEKGSGDTRIKYLVGTLASGEPRYDYLMEKPREWYNEDREKRLYEPLREIEKDILEGRHQNQIEDHARHEPTSRRKLSRS